MFSAFFVFYKALHSELLTELLSWNEFFAISEVRVSRHFFVIFGNFGIEQFLKFPKFPNIRKTLFPNFFRTFYELFPNFFRIFPNFLTQKQVFLTQKLKLYILFSKFSKFTYIFEVRKIPSNAGP